MESDHQAASENPCDGEEQGASNVRSYECNFCRRGFSNAQALGGHMNIHRKDKAKLKQQQSSSQIQQDQAKPGEESDKARWDWNVSQQEHVSFRSDIHTRQLPLFAESPTTTETQNPHGRQTTTEKAFLSTQDSSSELDLELRLGPEPQDSSPETGTRNFF